MQNTDQEISASSLTHKEWLSLTWGFFWRGACFTIASGLIGGLVGGILGFVVGIATVMVGGSIEAIKAPLQIISGLVGMSLSLYLFRYYIRWLLRARFGSFRLALVGSSRLTVGAT
jgi:ABC-type amino acid transport system permease subunit